METTYVDSLYTYSKSSVENVGNSILNSIYKNGVKEEIHNYSKDKLIYLKKGNEIEEVTYQSLLEFKDIESIILAEINKESLQSMESFYNEVFSKIVIPNISIDTESTDNEVEAKIKAINPNRGLIEKGGRIIAKGEVVEGDKFQILNSLKGEYESQVWSKSNFYWLILGYSVLISLVFLMLF